MVRRFTAQCLVYGALLCLSAAEFNLFERLLFRDVREFGFVIDNMHGILAGTPAFPGWQHRLLGAACFWLFEQLTQSPLTALETLTAFLLLAGNLLGFELFQRRTRARWAAFLCTAAFGFLHLLLLYRLEYPWDGIDVLLFLTFGQLARSPRGSLALAGICAAGTLNHETALYIPVWYLLVACDSRKSRSERLVCLRIGGLMLVAMCVTILGLRQALYVRAPSWAAPEAPDATVFGSPIHVVHNLRQLFVRNWGTSKTVISVAFLATTSMLLRMLRNARWRTASLWTLCVLATIVCFGYINETRLYLAPVAFWFGHFALVPTRDVAALSDARSHH